MDRAEAERRRRLRREYKQAERDRVVASLPVSVAQLAALVAYVDESVKSVRCNHTAAAAQRWSANNGIAWGVLGPALAEYGGFCDCEIVMNCDPRELLG